MNTDIPEVNGPGHQARLLHPSAAMLARFSPRMLIENNGLRYGSHVNLMAEMCWFAMQ